MGRTLWQWPASDAQLVVRNTEERNILAETVKTHKVHKIKRAEAVLRHSEARLSGLQCCLQRGGTAQAVLCCWQGTVRWTSHIMLTHIAPDARVYPSGTLQVSSALSGRKTGDKS